MTQRSQEYIQVYKRGPFPGTIDPWAEAGRYFHQIHAGMIGALLAQLQDDLIARGYQAGRETSLQVMESTQPDVFIHRPRETHSPHAWDYTAAAEAVLLEPGEALTGLQMPPELDAIFVKQIGGTLVTPTPENFLDGITRRAVMGLARKRGWSIEERAVKPQELQRASEVFLCGTAAEITPVVDVDKYRVGSGEIGPVTRELERAFDAALRGNEHRFAHWRTPVWSAVPVGAR